MDRTPSTSTPPADAARSDLPRCSDCGRQLPRWREGPVFCRCWRCEWFQIRFGGQADNIHAHGMGVRWEWRRLPPFPGAAPFGRRVTRARRGDEMPYAPMARQEDRGSPGRRSGKRGAPVPAPRQFIA